jgi:hypothetical protein
LVKASNLKTMFNLCPFVWPATTKTNWSFISIFDRFSQNLKSEKKIWWQDLDKIDTKSRFSRVKPWQCISSDLWLDLIRDRFASVWRDLRTNDFQSSDDEILMKVFTFQIATKRSNNISVFKVKHWLVKWN